MLPAERMARKPLLGNAKPRISPPRPARSLAAKWHETAVAMGIDPFPWQDTSAWFLYALGRGDAWMYREVLELVGRQNGKTEKLVPHIVTRLLMKRRIIHTAQNREQPREVFGRVADYIEKAHPELLPNRRGRTIAPRFANGQEEIQLTNGGSYRIVAPTRGGARGASGIDDLIIDEVREFKDHDFIGAAEPTVSASPNPQIYYLSSEGDEASEVLNSIKARAGEDPALAFLSWSAAPERQADDVSGWREANPAIGHIAAKLPTLEAMYRKHRLAGTLGIFETEYLCRPVASLRERFVDGTAWASLEEEDLGRPRNAYMGIALDPGMTRASAALAWRLPDQRIALRLLLDAPGSPIDPDDVGAELRKLQSKHGTIGVGYDRLTDAQLVRYVVGKPESIAGQKHANASARFAGAVASATLAWQDADAVSDDLVWTTRKPHDESGSFQAVRADDDRPITAALAAIRAVWLASGPPTGKARIW